MSLLRIIGYYRLVWLLVMLIVFRKLLMRTELDYRLAIIMILIMYIQSKVYKLLLQAILNSLILLLTPNSFFRLTSSWVSRSCLILWVFAIDLQLSYQRHVIQMCQQHCFRNGARKVLLMLNWFAVLRITSFWQGWAGGIQSCGSQMSTARLEWKSLMPSNHLR